MADFKALVKNHFDQKGLKYRDSDRGFLTVGFSGKNTNEISIIIDFDDDGDGKAAFICFSIGKFEQEQYAKGLVACNTCNSQYRWVKFCIDDDNRIVVRSDAILDENNCGEECLEIVMRMVGIIDESYPLFMKARWA